MTNKRYCLALDLKDDPKLIEEYDKYHEKVWPEIVDSIRLSGIQSVEIYRVENRLFMIMEVDETFTFDKKKKIDVSNNRVQEWEQLMLNFQQTIPHSKPGEKWRLMDKIFDLTSYSPN